jgi:hypothetical protein
MKTNRSIQSAGKTFISNHLETMDFCQNPELLSLVSLGSVQGLWSLELIIGRSV